MATVVTVHGTFANTGGTAEALNIAEADPQWWQLQSEFDADLKALVGSADGGPVTLAPFSWSSLNSELDRRAAGSELLKMLRRLDEQGEPYCVVGHSHGGSVVASALIESAAKKKPLRHLKRWITVGTPFVGMRKERFLFTRLTLARKVVFVASFMLFMMFLFYVGAEVIDGPRRFASERFFTALLFSGTMMSLPMAFFYIVFRYLDRRELLGYGRGAIARAREHYADKWLPLVHKDDEAVQGLRYLPKIDLRFFEKDFAASTLTKASIIALPLLYLFAVTSPPVMLAISDFLQTRVYGVQEFAGDEAAVTRSREELRTLGQRLREAREEADSEGLEPLVAEDARRRVGEIRRELAAKRRQLDEAFPRFADAERAQRFKRRFLMRDRKLCEGGRLCGGGHDYALNSKLLFHVVTDELSAAVVDEEFLGGVFGGVLRLIVPIVLVPVVFALIALGTLAVIQYIAALLSALLSRLLNWLTLAEVKRSTFGNDTEGEIVVGADYAPSWLDPVTCLLPAEVSDAITDHSNAMAAQSLSKFRNAISTFAFSEGEAEKGGLISNYLSWKELVHTCYFDVPAFRKIVALAVSEAEGFAPTSAFLRDAAFARTAQWVAVLGQRAENGLAADIAGAAHPPPERPLVLPA
ncbi:hypothetical protein [Hyphomicrobium sp.]|uniref:hypothetical protein n=1 Tax=Hyphomicrobium sp. TaxID=82 RepID=UPI002FDD14C9